MSMIDNFPDDKSTIFSIVPFEIFEFKPGLYPGSYRIPGCKNDEIPVSKIIGPSEHLMTIGGKKEPARIITPSYQIAASIVRDYIEGQLFASENAMPGITWLQGKISSEEFRTKHKDVYEKIKSDQKGWFIRTCKETDNDWKKYNNYRVVSDLARFAAKSLGLESEWLKTEEVGYTYLKCKACSTMNDPRNAICSNCRCILDEKKYSELRFAGEIKGATK